jgi:hypothetical protein
MAEKSVLKNSNRVASAVEGAGIRKLLDPRAAAEILGISAETLSVWRCEKRYPLRYVKVGRRIFYRPEDLEAFIQVRSATGTSDSSATKPRTNQKSRCA